MHAFCGKALCQFTLSNLKKAANLRNSGFRELKKNQMKSILFETFIFSGTPKHVTVKRWGKKPRFDNFCVSHFSFQRKMVPELLLSQVLWNIFYTNSRPEARQGKVQKKIKLKTKKDQGNLNKI